MTTDVRTRVLTYDRDKRWACTGLRKGPGKGAGEPCGHDLVLSASPLRLTCENESCENHGLLIEHPDLRSCNVSAKENHHVKQR